MTTLDIQPRLIVANPDAAASYYATTLGAEIGLRIEEPSGSIAHLELRIGEARLSLAQSNQDYGLHDPATYDGSPVLLTAVVSDAKAVGAAMIAAGAQTIIPIEDRDYGKCEGRLRDPFGHLWVISQTL